MDLKMTIKAPNLNGDPNYDSDDSTDSKMNTSSNSSTFNVTLPLISFLTINTWLLATWTFEANPRYLCNLNLSKLRDAPAHIWNLPAGVAPGSLLLLPGRSSLKPSTPQLACSQQLRQQKLSARRSVSG